MGFFLLFIGIERRAIDQNSRRTADFTICDDPGTVALAKERGITVEEQDVKYGELVEWARTAELVAICSIGTAGILNRCSTLHLVDNDLNVIARHSQDSGHPLVVHWREMRADYWGMYTGRTDIPSSLSLEVHQCNSVEMKHSVYSIVHILGRDQRSRRSSNSTGTGALQFFLEVSWIDTPRPAFCRWIGTCTVASR